MTTLLRKAMYCASQGPVFRWYLLSYTSYTLHMDVAGPSETLTPVYQSK
jgi:hypothetical protein